MTAGPAVGRLRDRRCRANRTRHEERARACAKAHAAIWRPSLAHETVAAVFRIARPRIQAGAVIDRISDDVPDQLHHCRGKRFRFFLRQVVPRVRDDPMREAVGELRCVRAAVGDRNDAVGIAVERDGRHRDGGLTRQLVLNFPVAWVAVDQAVPMTIGVDHDVDVIGIVVRLDATVERGLVEFPVRRPLAPQDFGDIRAIGSKTGPTTISSGSTTGTRARLRL